VMKIAFKYRSDGIFVSEMPVYRSPRWQNVGFTIWAKCAAFLTQAGKIIVIISVILWGLSSFAPENRLAEVDKKYEMIATTQPQSDSLSFAHSSERLKVSYAGIIGRSIEPVIKPLGYDWKIGIALLTSFAAREVFTGTMGIIYGMGNDFDVEDEAQRQTLTSRISSEYSRATALSLLIFYAFAMQCISTLAVTKRETGSWKWAGVMLLYLTALAYIAAWITYQLAL
jgi:ferrous iron transport protein B